MIKYRAIISIKKIECVECVKETDSSIWIDEGEAKPRRYAKATDHSIFVDTWEYAKKLLVDHYRRRIEAAEYQLRSAQNDFDDVAGMERPRRDLMKNTMEQESNK